MIGAPDLLAHALRYGARRRVLPLHTIATGGRCSCGAADCGTSAGKHPRTRRGIYDASADERVIRRWWGLFPDSNVGVVTGARSGLLVLDVDPRHGGDSALAELERQRGALPETVRALTGGGGVHYYFAHGEVAPSRPVAPGLDVKASGGYVVAPPSLHVSGRRYAWEIGAAPEEMPLARAPRWLLDRLTLRNGNRLRRDGAELVIAEGERNHRLAQLAGVLRRYGLGERAICAALLAVNRHHVQPPLAEAEVRGIAASVARYAPAQATGTS